MPTSPRSPASVFAQAVPRAGNALPHHVPLETPARPSGPSPALPGLPAATGLLPPRPPSPDLEASACHIGWSSARVSSCLRRETCLFTGGATTWLTTGAPGCLILSQSRSGSLPLPCPNPKQPPAHVVINKGRTGPAGPTATLPSVSEPLFQSSVQQHLRGRVRHRDPQLMLLGGR